MTDQAARLAKAMAMRSSRRSFFRLLGASAAATGAQLLGLGPLKGVVTLPASADVSACAGCGGGPCDPCASPHPRCYQCRTGGGCHDQCTTSGEWFCCFRLGASECWQRCSECNCFGSGTLNPGCCHCFTITIYPCTLNSYCGS